MFYLLDLAQRRHEIIALRLEDQTLLVLHFPLPIILLISPSLIGQLKPIALHLDHKGITSLTNWVLLVNVPDTLGRTLHRKTYWLWMVSVDGERVMRWSYLGLCVDEAVLRG
jgi:hypothetical protein